MTILILGFLGNFAVNFAVFYFIFWLISLGIAKFKKIEAKTLSKKVQIAAAIIAAAIVTNNLFIYPGK